MRTLTTLFCMTVLVILVGCSGSTPEPAEEPAAETAEAVEPTSDEQMAGLVQMCTDAQAAIEARQAETPLYDRIGGREGIHAMVADTIQRHLVNEDIKHLMEGVDAEHLVELVTDYLVVETGGEGEYNGRDLHESHAAMNLTNADFLSAGGDIGAAMDDQGWGENEKQEVLCLFVNRSGEVITQ